MRYHGLSRADGLLDCLKARLLLESGRPDEAAHLIETAPVARDFDDGAWLESDHVLPVQSLIALQASDAARARAIAAEMARRCEEGARKPAEIRANILIARADAALDAYQEAMSALRHAVRLATRETVRQPFLEHSARILPLLRDLQQDRAAFSDDEAKFLADLILRLDASARSVAHIQRLTTRERDILTQLQPGRSNKVIARNLDLSENAVKFHLKNLFRKLEVTSRSEAANIAQHFR